MCSRSVMPETLSCAHKHTIQCLLMNTSICCLCADRRNASEPLLLGVDQSDINVNHVPGFDFTKYCGPCQDYWRNYSMSQVSDIPISQVLQSSLAAFNLPETTAGRRSYHAGRTHHHCDNQTILHPTTGGTGSSTRPRAHQRARSHQHHNISTLRNELQAINSDISRVLSSLHDLRQESQFSQATMWRNRIPRENTMNSLPGVPIFDTTNMPTQIYPGLQDSNQANDLPETVEQLPHPGEQMNVDQFSVPYNNNSFEDFTSSGGPSRVSQQMPTSQTPFVAVPMSNYAMEQAGFANLDTFSSSGVSDNSSAAPAGNDSGSRNQFDPSNFDQMWPGDDRFLLNASSPYSPVHVNPIGLGSSGTDASYTTETVPSTSSAASPMGGSPSVGMFGTNASYATDVLPSWRTETGRTFIPTTSNLPPPHIPPHLASPSTSSSPPHETQRQMLSRMFVRPNSHGTERQRQITSRMFALSHVHRYGSRPHAAPMNHQNHQNHQRQVIRNITSNGANTSHNDTQNINQSVIHNSRRRPRSEEQEGPHQSRRSIAPRLEGSGESNDSLNLHFPISSIHPVAGVPASENATSSHIPPPAEYPRAETQMQGLQIGDLQRGLRAAYHTDRMQINDQRQTIFAPQSSARRPVAPTIPNPLNGLDDPYGKRPRPKDADDMNVNLECKVCMSQKVDTVLIPCGHAVLCRWCVEPTLPGLSKADPFAENKTSCPMCRQTVTQTLRIYLN